ncbi:MAG: hypothetical protein ACYDDA_07560 [Acidiferrobacteraceae bacterium]
MSMYRLMDLRERPPGMSAHQHAYHGIRDLPERDYVALFVEENPRFLQRRLERLLGHPLFTRIERHRDMLWYVEIGRTPQALNPCGIGDLMCRDHVRLNRIFLESERLLLARHPEGVPLMARFAVLMARHIYVESQILAPLLSPDQLGHAQAPVAIMRQGHGEIAREIAIMVQFLDTRPVDLDGLTAVADLVAATVLPGELGEETRVFPLWDHALRARGDTGKILRDIQLQLHASIAPRGH